MFFTERFRTVIPYLALAALLLVCLHTFLMMNGLISYDQQEEIVLSREFLKAAIPLLSALTFWGAIGFLTQAWQAVAWAFAFNLMGIIYSSWQFYSGAVFQEGFHDGINWVRQGLRLATYLSFGWFYFRSNKVFWMALLFLANWVNLPFFEYANVLEKPLEWIGIDNPFMMKIEKESGEVTYMNWASNFFSTFNLIASVIVFWMFIVVLRAKEKVSWKLLTTDWHPKFDRLSFSLAYWALHVALLGTVLTEFQIFVQLLFKNLSPNGFMPLKNFLSLLSVLLSIYIAGSFYRNFLVSFFSMRATYPTWLYWLLNIPGLNFFAWIYAIEKPLTVKQSTVDTIDGAELSAGTAIQEVRDSFDANDRNGTIKGVFIAVSVINIVSMLVMRSSQQLPFSFLFSLSLGLAVIVWYVYSDSALWFIWPAQAILLILFIASFPPGSILKPIWSMTIAGMINVVMYYGLFHFHKMLFYQEGDAGEEEE